MGLFCFGVTKECVVLWMCYKKSSEGVLCGRKLTVRALYKNYINAMLYAKKIILRN